MSNNLTPSQEIDNQLNNEALINSINIDNEITTKEGSNSNDEFIVLFDNKSLICFLFILILIIPLPISIVFFVLRKILIGISLFLILSVIIVLIYFSIHSKGLNFRKIIKENILEIKNKNYLGCSLKTINVFLDNINFIVEDKEKYEGYDMYMSAKFHYTSIYIVNNLKNFQLIDIDKSNILNKPIFLFYEFKSIKSEIEGGSEELQKKLNDFINSPPNIRHLKFIISPFDKNIRYKLITEHFYSYKVKDKEPSSNIGAIVFIFLAFNIFFWIIFYFTSMEIEEKSASVWIGYITGYLILMALFVLIAKQIYNTIIRIDFIFSNNYDRIFIGFVRENGKSYKRKYIFEINCSDKFVLERAINESFLLKLFVSNEYIDIYQLNGEKLQKFVNALNEKFKKNNQELEGATILP